MPRAKSDTVEYFPHFSDGGRTVFILESEYGNDGYAFWFKLLELLACSDGHFYDLNKPGAARFLYAKTRVDADKAHKILSTLADLEKIDPALYAAGIIWCQRFVDNLKELYAKRQRPCPEKPVLPLQQEGRVSESETQSEPAFPGQKREEDEVSGPEMHQRKGKEIKGEEIKEPATAVAGSPGDHSSEERAHHPEAVILAGRFVKLMQTHMPEIMARMKNGYLAEWQAVFDRLIHTDNRDPTEIGLLVEHCFDIERSWWARTRNIRSPAKLRRRNPEGVYYYDVILEEMKSAAHQKNTGGNEGGRRNPAPFGDGKPYPVDYTWDGETGEFIHHPRES
mgnify:CR=1 FL=1